MSASVQSQPKSEAAAIVAIACDGTLFGASLSARLSQDPALERSAATRHVRPSARGLHPSSAQADRLRRGSPARPGRARWLAAGTSRATWRATGERACARGARRRCAESPHCGRAVCASCWCRPRGPSPRRAPGDRWLPRLELVVVDGRCQAAFAGPVLEGGRNGWRCAATPTSASAGTAGLWRSPTATLPTTSPCWNGPSRPSPSTPSASWLARRRTGVAADLLALAARLRSSAPPRVAFATIGRPEPSRRAAAARGGPTASRAHRSTLRCGSSRRRQDDRLRRDVERSTLSTPL